MRSFLRFTIRCGLLTAVLIARVPLRASASAAPELSLSLIGTDDDTVERGEPLRVTVRLEAPAAVTLAPASGAWVDAIGVELAPAGGGAPVARGEPVGRPDVPHATLDATHVAGGLWRISSAAMQHVAPGDYVVRVRLAIRGGSGWTGEAVSDDTPLQIVAASEAPARASPRAVNRAYDALLGGRIEEAASILDAALQRAPDDARLLLARADVAERGGNPVAAMICLNHARRPDLVAGTSQPSIAEDELRTRITAALLRENGLAANPPAWTWPPAAVLASVPPAGTTAPKTETARSPSIPPAPNPVLPATPATPAKIPDVASSSSPSSASRADSPTLLGGVVLAAELTDAKIVADPAGQWAASATAGSQYGRTQYSATQATGAPNVPVAGNSPDAWCPAVRDKGMDWLEVTFAKPVQATELRVRQNDASGAIAKIEAIEANGTAHVWWEGIDPYVVPGVREIVWFGVRVPKTAYAVARVKLTLNLASGPGYKEIDAVQLVGVP